MQQVARRDFCAVIVDTAFLCYARVIFDFRPQHARVIVNVFVICEIHDQDIVGVSLWVRNDDPRVAWSSLSSLVVPEIPGVHGPLTITGSETSDITIIMSVSTNKSFEWKDADMDGLYEPLDGDTVVDMGIRGLIPMY